MPPRRTAKKSTRSRRRGPKLSARIAALWIRARHRALHAFLAAPRAIQVSVGILLVLVMWAASNGVYQVFRKPAELFFPVSHALAKLPAQTWREYRSVFRAHATDVITAEFLAALAQVEGAGNPVARTYWRWQATWDVFEIYRPASSAVGMYQITDANFAEAKRLCIHNHRVVEDGPWHALSSCWFNSLYSRVVPTHAAEMTAAYLDRRVALALEGQGITTATVQQRQDLAALIHLCGAGAGRAYARRQFRLTANQHCGDHDVAGYLGRVNRMKALFASFDEQAASR